MATTKTHPGAFACYEAALPDEPIFTILGRDIAGPATLRFWANERERLGMFVKPDDLERLEAARTDSHAMTNWRGKIMDSLEPGDVPPWRLPRQIMDAEKPIRSNDWETINLPEGMHNAADLLKIEELEARLKDMLYPLVGVMEDGTTQRVRLWTPPVEPEDDTINLLKERKSTFAPAMAAPYELDVTIKVAVGLRQIADAMDEATDNYGPKARVETLNFRDRIAGFAAELEANHTDVYRGFAQSIGMFKVPGVEFAQTMDNIEATYRERDRLRADVEKGRQEITRLYGIADAKPPTVDSEPDDLAHSPEVPHHRFAVFNEGKEYAYARGLEVNPSHLPTALDAMSESGWSLMSIFGATDSKNVGFIFKKKALWPKSGLFTGGKLTVGGEPIPVIGDYDEIVTAMPEDIRTRTFTIHGKDPEVTYHRRASWTGDLEQARRWMQEWRPDKRNAFLLSEKTMSVTHYWSVASVASVLRFIVAVQKRADLWLADTISAVALSEVLGCLGQDCIDMGRGLEP